MVITRRLMNGRRYPMRGRKMRKGPPRQAFSGVKEDMSVTTWNVEGKGSPEDVDKALMKTPKRTPNLICLQEANLPSPGEGTENYNWLCTGSYGSAILVRKTSSLKTSTFERHCDQICSADVTGDHDITVKVISCYVPPSTDYLCEDIWTKLTEVIKAIPSNKSFMVAGDFNAELGQDISKEKSLVGPVLHHKVSNENGIFLQSFVRKAHLKVLNTFQRRINPGVKTCFTYKDGETKSQRDYILSRYSQLCLNEGAFTDWHPEYKHAMLCSKLLIVPSKESLDKEKTHDPVDNAVEKTVEKTAEKTSYLVGTWNIQSTTPAKVDVRFTEQNLPVVCVQELFLTSDEDIQTENYTWYSSKKLWSKNVAIVVKKAADLSLTNFNSTSEYLCSADIVYQGKSIKVVSIYLPPSEDSKHETVTKELSELVKGVPKETFLIVAGDFNTKLFESEKAGDKEPSDPNLVFLNNLVKEEELCIKDSKMRPWQTKSTYAMTQITESSKGSPHHFLVSKSMDNEFNFKTFIKWVCFHEHAILCLSITHPKETTTIKRVTLKSSENVEGKEIKEDVVVKEEVIGDSVHRIKEFEYYESDEEDATVETTPLSPEDVEKFKDTPPSVEDLSRILPDFIIFYKSDRKSSTVVSSPAILLMRSFKECKLGKLTFEGIDVLDKESRKRTGVICKISWNGILLSKFQGAANDRLFTVRKKCASELVGKLGQVCYTLKGKKSFFNRGKAPIFMNEDSLADFFRVVEKKECPTTEDVEKYIEEFFAKDTCCDLAFGEGFSDAEIKRITSYAKSNDLGYRYFHKTVQQKRVNHIAVFKKYTPQHLRDMLKEKKEDPKYYLIPPSGMGEDYYSFIMKYEQTNFKEEMKAISHPPNESKPSGTGDDKKTKPTSDNPHRVSRQDRQRKAQTLESRMLQALTKAPAQRSDTQPNSRKRRGGRNQPGPSSRGSESYRSGGRAVNRPMWDEPRYDRDSGHQYDDYDSERPAWDVPRNYESHNPEPQRKRQRMDSPQRQSDSLPPLSKPPWRDLAPLILVWPVTISSIIEERPRQVLDANFATEYILGSQNKAAAVVALPMRNGREKKYCLTIADGLQRAAETALRLIVKHSTVIKPHANYLCNGSVPNFIRYKVPCQRNPRTYIILERRDTGPLTVSSVREIFESFLVSFNEDVFFDKDEYSFYEKMLLIEEAPKYDLNVRHFGDAPGVVNRYVCVYKKRPNIEILEEVLKMRGFHPKYTMTTDRLPPRLSLNVF